MDGLEMEEGKRDLCICSDQVGIPITPEFTPFLESRAC